MIGAAHLCTTILLPLPPPSPMPPRVPAPAMERACRGSGHPTPATAVAPHSIRRGTISAADIVTDAVVAAERFDDDQVPASLRSHVRGPCFGHTGMMAAAQAIFADMQARGMLTALVGSREEADACQAPRGQGPPSRGSMYDADTGEGPGEPGTARTAGNAAAAVGSGLAGAVTAVGTAVGVAGQAMWDRLPGTPPETRAQSPGLTASPENADAGALYSAAAHEDIEAPARGAQESHGECGAGLRFQRGVMNRPGPRAVCAFFEQCPL